MKDKILAKIPISVELKNTSRSKKPYRRISKSEKPGFLYLKYYTRIRNNKKEICYKLNISIIKGKYTATIPKQQLLTVLAYAASISGIKHNLGLQRHTKQDNETKLIYPLKDKKKLKQVVKRLEELRKPFFKKARSYKFTGKIK